MNQTPHCCGSWSLAPAGREMWSSEESRAIRAITRPATAWIQPWRSRQQRRRGRGEAFANSGADSGDGSIRTKATGSQSPRLVHVYALVMAHLGHGCGGRNWASAPCPSKGARPHHIWCAKRLHEGHALQGITQHHQRGGLPFRTAGCGHQEALSLTSAPAADRGAWPPLRAGPGGCVRGR